MFKKAVRGLVAALTTPDAVKAEKSLAVIIVARVLLAVGASAGLVTVATDVLSKL